MVSYSRLYFLAMRDIPKIVKNYLAKILHWSQKYTRADMFYIAKTGSWVTFGQMTNNILSLALLVAFANLLPKETYGIYRYILSIAGILGIFTLTGMSSAVVRTVATGNEGILRPALKYQLKWNVLMLTTFLLLSGYYFFNGDTVFATAFLILGFFAPLTQAFSIFGVYLSGKKEFQKASVLSILATFVYSLGMLAALLFTDEVVWLIGIYAGTTCIASIAAYTYTQYKYKPPVSNDVRETFKYARELTYIRFMGPVVAEIDKIILVHFWGPAQLATYALASAIPTRIIALTKGWLGVGLPKFATKTPQEINTVFFMRILQGMAIGSAITVGYVLISPLLFTYLLPQYLDGVFYSQILAISFIFAMPNRYISHLFESQRLSRQIFINNLVNSILAIVLYILLGMWGGILGLAVAQVLYSSIGMIINIVMWRFVRKN